MSIFKGKLTWEPIWKKKRASIGHSYNALYIAFNHPSRPGIEIHIELTQDQREHLTKWFDLE